MQRAALAYVVVAACKGGDKPAEPAPRAMPVVGDATSSDAAVAAPCFAVPLDAAGEKAGLRLLANRAQHVETDVLLAVPKGVTRLDPGQPALVKRLRAPLSVPPINADALVAMAKPKGRDFELTAPPHLEGAVIELRSEKGDALLAIGNAGLMALERFRENIAKPRVAEAAKRVGDKIALVYPLAIFHDDIDGDGTVELVAYTGISYEQMAPSNGLGMLRGDEFMLDVLWATGELATVSRGGGADPPRHALFLAPPTLSGGKTLLFTADGDRFAVENKTLTALPTITGRPPSKSRRRPGADLGAQIAAVRDGKSGSVDAGTPADAAVPLDAAIPSDVVTASAEPKEPCLQTSATEPAKLAAPP